VKVAVVTGANRGIGFEIARELAQAGCRVVLAARDARKGEAAAGKLQEAGLDVIFRELDVAQSASIKAFMQGLARDPGRVDVLVNNAGIAIDAKGARLVDSDPEVYRRTLETNLMGPLQLIQAVLPLMQRQNYGRIVNLSSGLGQLTEMSTGTPAYRISKTALNALTRIAAAEARAKNILVNSMCPGWVKTDMGGAAAPRTVEQGADTAVWLATLPDGGPTGGFFRDRVAIAW
jgi:NAD(P)-dependent dehydrogenase (short-subunit alcohol dehydrogenase family)